MTNPWIAAYTAVSAVALLNGLVTLGLLRRIGGVLEQAEAMLRYNVTPPGGLAPGSPIPEFVANRPDGSEAMRSDVRNATIVFMSSGCQPCKRLAADIGEHWTRMTSPMFLVVVLNDPNEAEELELPVGIPILYQPSGRMSAAFETSATPHVFITDSDQIVANGTPNSFAGILALAPARREVRTAPEPALPARQ